LSEKKPAKKRRGGGTPGTMPIEILGGQGRNATKRKEKKGREQVKKFIGRHWSLNRTDRKKVNAKKKVQEKRKLGEP